VNGADTLGEELATWGKVALIETRGRISRAPVRTAVGFIAETDGTLLIAAGDEHADWALNLRHDPLCTATIGDHAARYEATELVGSERNSAISALILKYGTPAERLGPGPAFRLRPSP
jgi:deazaflavin-dependent oxidoreductase (nitroreductase family)